MACSVLLYETPSTLLCVRWELRQFWSISGWLMDISKRSRSVFEGAPLPAQGLKKGLSDPHNPAAPVTNGVREEGSSPLRDRFFPKLDQLAYAPGPYSLMSFLLIWCFESQPCPVLWVLVLPVIKFHPARPRISTPCPRCSTSSCSSQDCKEAGHRLIIDSAVSTKQDLPLTPRS